MYRGGAKGKLGDYLGGIEDYDKAIELKPNPYYYFSRGKLKKALGNYDGAIQDYNKALEFVPDDASIYAERGLTKIDDGQKESGCEDLSKAVELEKKVTVPNEKYNIEFKKHCK
jgi:tetratricopeptide (TPR) repeat protein